MKNLLKNKKVLSVVLAAAVCIAAVAPLSACQRECDHDYGGWKVIQAPTCSEGGTEQGVCRICGDVTTRPVDPVADGHSYGEWQITAPTEAAQGKAVKTCVYNSAHTVEVALPAITESGEGYDSSEITKQPTVSEAGERRFVLEHELGDIVFTVSVASTEIKSVADAVQVGASNASQIRQVTGKVSGDTERFPISDFSYEFGENYTHIIDGADNTERWYTVDESGEIFGIYRYSTDTPVQDPGFNAQYLKGYSYAIARAGGERYYGCEDMLSKMYTWAKASTNGDFAEGIVKTDGQTTYKFSFSHLNMPYYLCLITVEFTLTDTGAIKNFVMYSVAYDRDSWELNEETGYYNVTDPDGFHYTEYIEFDQTTVYELPADYVPPVSPYTKDSLLVASFDLLANGKVVTDETVVDIEATAGFWLRVENMQPELANFTYDPPTVYWRTESGDVLLDYVATDSNIACYYNSTDNSIYIRSMIAGDVTIVVKPKSGKCERVVHFNVKRIAPTALTPSLYEYGDAGYVWNSSATAATVYVGQPLYFRALVPTLETTYADAGFIAAVTTAGNGATAEATELDGQNVYRFVATAAGEYTVVMRSTAKATITCTITVNVLPAPAIGGLLNGAYTGKLEYPTRGIVTAVFKPSEYSSSEGTVEITTGQGKETLSYSYDGQTLTTTHLSGADFGFSLSINEAYRLVLTHPTGFGDSTERVVLTKS